VLVCVLLRYKLSAMPSARLAYRILSWDENLKPWAHELLPPER
jgi:hypothetical protein